MANVKTTKKPPAQKKTETKPRKYQTRKRLPQEPTEKIPPANNGKHPGGRPSEYTLEVALEICSRVSNGQSLRTICRDDSMPAKESVLTWLVKHPEFLAHYTQARVEAADAMAEEIIDICDDGTNDWMIANAGTENEKTVMNSEHVQRSRLRVDTRKWLMAKLQPKKYGEKIDHNHEGGLTVNIRKLGK